MLLKGILLGFSIAAPVGPIGLLCIHRALERGFLSAFTAGLGAALADACYGLVGVLGLTTLMHFLTTQAAGLRVGGALFLLYLAWRSWWQAPARQAATVAASGWLRGLLATCLLTLSNPMTILSFLAVFAGMGIPADSGLGGLQLVLGVLLGSAAWWALLAGIASRCARYLSPARLVWLNRASAILLAGFAVAALMGAWEAWR
ncbi:LysE family translocator [Chitinimonas arctica]|uniref:LysE family translocator n=2 Tax=Chitinimonas arctica TaxID=2594795 RepID=A0A516SMI0_9NEIS|nr:LysE family translocator [Chitinimonas arctica]